jgi:hypothetical protein
LGSRIISRSVRLSTGVSENLFETFLTRSHPLNWREQAHRLIDSGFLNPFVGQQLTLLSQLKTLRSKEIAMIAG